MPKDQESPPSAPQFLCQYANISECLPIEAVERFTLTLWNPTIHTVTDLTRVPVTKDYTIRDPLGQLVTAEVREGNDTSIDCFLWSIFRFHRSQREFLVERVLPTTS